MPEEKIDEEGYMYNPKSEHIDKQKLDMVLASINDKYATIYEDALLLLIQEIADGKTIVVAVDYPRIMEDLYKERTLDLIRELQECL